MSQQIITSREELLSYTGLYIDIDGTAVNSEPIIREVIGEISLPAGYKVEPKHWDTLAGLGDKGVWAKICEWHPPFAETFVSGPEFEKARLKRYVERIDEVQPHQSVLDLTNAFLDAGKPAYAVTNSPPRIAVPHLKGTGYPLDCMAGLITETEANNLGLPSKPQPAMYDMAIERERTRSAIVGLSADFTKVSCLAVEDSPTGVEAGLRAGMTVIQLTDMCGQMDDTKVSKLQQEFGGIYVPMTFSELQGLVSSPNVAHVNGARAPLEQHIDG